MAGHSIGTDGCSSVRSDFFISYNRVDQVQVQEVLDRLAAQRCSYWYDMQPESLSPGQFWQHELTAAIERVRGVIVFLGPSGPGPWQDEEIQHALRQSKLRKLLVAPVILHGYRHKDPPGILANRVAVDRRLYSAHEVAKRLCYALEASQVRAPFKHPAQPNSQPPHPEPSSGGSNGEPAEPGSEPPNATFKREHKANGMGGELPPKDAEYRKLMEACRIQLFAIVALPVVARALEYSFGCKGTNQVVVDAMLEHARDPDEFALRLLVAAEELQRHKGPGWKEALRQRPFSAVLQLLSPIIIGRAYQNDSGEVTSHSHTLACLEAGMARIGARRAYWTSTSAQTVVGSHCIAPGLGETGWSPKQGMQDIVRLLAARLGRPVPEASADIETLIDDLDRVLEYNARHLSMHSEEAREARYEEELHEFYAPIYRGGSGDGAALIEGLRNAIPSLRLALVETTPRKEVHRQEKNVEASILAIMDIEALSETEEHHA